jgi:dienelactone hydrolase
MNLEHIPELREELGEEVSREFSPTHHLKNSTLNPPPMLVVKAGLDKAIFNDSIDEFIHAGLSRNLTLDVMTHPAGHHAFDVMDDNERSRVIIQRTVDFFKLNLLA